MNKKFVMACLTCLAWVVGGCTTEPLRRASDALPAAYEAGGVSSALPAQSLDQWWMSFEDPPLETLITQALQSAPDARSAQAVLEEALALRDQALSRFRPQGGISASATRQNNEVSGISGPASAAVRSGGTTTYSAGFTPNWELGLFGRSGALRDAAEADLAAARFLYEASRQSLASNVAGSVFEIRGLQLQLAEAVDSERIARELADVGKARVRVGIGAPVDAAALDAQAATAAANRQALEAQLAVATRTLLVLLGRGAERSDSLAIDPRINEPPPVPAVAPGELLSRRPDVREAQARLQSAAGNLRLDELALLPSFNLIPGVSITRIVGASGYTNSLWSLGLGLSLPVLDRPRLLAVVRAQRARGEQAVIAYEKAVQTAYGEAENTLTTYAADRARLGLLVAAEERARYAFEAQRKGYQAGIVDATTLLNAERTWRSARTQLSSLRTTTLTDAVNVFRALGGGWTPAASAGTQTDTNRNPR